MVRLLTIVILFIACLAYGQEVVETSGEAQVKVERNMSKEDAMEEARQQAMIIAIEKVFGSYVEQDSDISIEDGQANFKIIGHSLVKGDWLKTINEKFKEDSRIIKGDLGKETETWINCKIKGVVREITKPDTRLNFKPLSCPEMNCHTYSFYDGTPLYLSFSSPVDGFLSVYIVEPSNIALRILPYQSMPKKYLNAVPVEADIKYTFFANSEEYNYFEGFPYLLIDEIIMETELKKEHYDLYVIFSSNPFEKPLLLDQIVEEDKDLIPKNLGLIEFEEWLQETRIYDSEFQYQRITLTVLK